MTKTLNDLDLRQFTGTETWFRHWLVRDILFTEGAKYVADECGAYWLLDEIVFAQRGNPAVAAEPFQAWKLAVHANHTGTLRCEDGNYHTVFTKALTFTDFPQPGIELWFTDKVILLPSEY